MSGHVIQQKVGIHIGTIVLLFSPSLSFILIIEKTLELPFRSPTILFSVRFMLICLHEIFVTEL